MYLHFSGNVFGQRQDYTKNNSVFLNLKSFAFLDKLIHKALSPLQPGSPYHFRKGKPQKLTSEEAMV